MGIKILWYFVKLSSPVNLDNIIFWKRFVSEFFDQKIGIMDLLNQSDLLTIVNELSEHLIHNSDIHICYKVVKLIKYTDDLNALS